MIIAIRLKTGRDDDLMAWLDSLGEREKSHHIREALRYYKASQVKPENLFPDLENRLGDWFV